MSRTINIGFLIKKTLGATSKYAPAHALFFVCLAALRFFGRPSLAALLNDCNKLRKVFGQMLMIFICSLIQAL